MRIYNRILLGFTGVMWMLQIVLPHFASAQENTTAPSWEQAMAYFQKQDWENAAAAFKTITEREPSKGAAWLRLGLTYHTMKRYEQAISAYQEAEKLNFAPQIIRYNLACSNALMGKNQQAFEWLDKALEAGFSNVQGLKSDQDLASLRDEARFRKIVERADRNARPCEYDERYRAFDFWIGEWEVYNPQGQKIGMNVITKIQNGCALQENWSSAFGSGMSINYLDPVSGKWKQNWVNNKGGIVWYEGEMKDGAMHFSGENISSDGARKMTRVVLEPLSGGNVRHVIEHSTDDGKTWSVYFEGTYVPKGNGTSD